MSQPHPDLDFRLHSRYRDWGLGRPAGLSVALLIVGIAIPFYEEVIYRGFLFGALNRRWGAKAALVVSSIVFAVIHGTTYALPLMFLAFALGWI